MKKAIILIAPVIIALTGCVPDASQIIAQQWARPIHWTPILWPDIPGCSPTNKGMPCMVPVGTTAQKNWIRSKNRNQRAEADKHWHSMSSSQRHKIRQEKATASQNHLIEKVASVPANLSHNAPQWLEAWGAVKKARADEQINSRIFHQLKHELIGK